MAVELAPVSAPPSTGPLVVVIVFAVLVGAVVLLERKSPETIAKFLTFIEGLFKRK